MTAHACQLPDRHTKRERFGRYPEALWAGELGRYFHLGHINMLGRYSSAVPEAVAQGELRSLRASNEPYREGSSEPPVKPI